jgi:TonB family protein
MRILGSALTIGCLAAASTATAAFDDLRVYPILRDAGLGFVVGVDKRGRISKCEPADPATAPAAATASCVKIIAKGVPADLTPARAVGDPASWLTPDDHPSAAADRSGTVEVLFEIDEQGRVSDCLTYKTSSVVDLDKVACAAMVQRGKFKPAVYRGKPIRAAGTQTFRFHGS